MRAQYTTEAGFACEVDPLVGQRRDDPRRRGVGEARFIGDRDDPSLFGFAQRVRRDRTIGIWPPIAPEQTVTGLPAPQGAGIDTRQGTGRGEPGSVRTGLFNVTHQDLAVFQAGHSSSPSWKTSPRIFDSTSKAAVSASALVLTMKLPLQLLDPPAILPSFHGAGRPRLAETADRILLPGVQLRRIQTLLAAPGAPAFASSIAAVTITACNRAAAVQRGLPAPAPLDKASARQRSNVATLIATSRDTCSTDELSGGNSLATIRALYACPYRAIS